MKKTLEPKAAPRSPLHGKTAEDLMTPNPVSIRDAATIREAVNLLTDRGISAAPVIDGAGRPIGVLSRADLLVHDREKVDSPVPVPEYYEQSELATESGEILRSGLQVEKADATRVGDIMTPVVFAVAPRYSAAHVAEEMVALKVHRLFVIDGEGVLVGVISALDVLRQLCA